MGIIHKGVAGRANARRRAVRSVSIRNDEARVDSRKDIPVLIRDDDRPVLFDRDDACFLDQGSEVRRFRYSIKVEQAEQDKER